MTNDKTIDSKVVPFAQTACSTREFHHDYPITDELRDRLLGDVYRDLANFVWEHAFPAFRAAIHDYVAEHYIPLDKKESLELNLLWWKMIQETALEDTVNIVEAYIDENYYHLKANPIIISWLREWYKARPRIYYVGYKYNDRILSLIDTVTETAVDVVVYDSAATPPKQGGMVTGTLIPIGDGLYFPIIDFYHFDYEARGEIVRHLDHYYEKHLHNSSELDAYIHVLSAMLQIERYVFFENKEEQPTS